MYCGRDFPHTGRATNVLGDENCMFRATTAVVVAFTEKNIHQDLNAMIPNIMITPTRVVICIYNVQKDFLFLSDTFQWVEKTDEDAYELNKAAFFYE